MQKFQKDFALRHWVLYIRKAISYQLAKPVAETWCKVWGTKKNLLSPQIEKFGGAVDSLYRGTKCWLNGNLLANCMV